MSKNPEQFAIAGALLSIQNLTDAELAALNLCVQQDFGDPRKLAGYEKVESLFTLDGGTRCHDLVKQAFAQAVLQRLT